MRFLSWSQSDTASGNTLSKEKNIPPLPIFVLFCWGHESVYGYVSWIQQNSVFKYTIWWVWQMYIQWCHNQGITFPLCQKFPGICLRSVLSSLAPGKVLSLRFAFAKTWYKWNHPLGDFPCLASFIRHGATDSHLSCSIYKYFVLFYWQAVFQCIDTL